MTSIRQIYFFYQIKVNLMASGTEQQIYDKELKNRRRKENKKRKKREEDCYLAEQTANPVKRKIHLPVKALLWRMMVSSSAEPLQLKTPQEGVEVGGGGSKQKHFLYLLFTCIQQLHLVCQALNCRLQILVFILQPLNLIFFLSAKQRYSAMSSHTRIQAHMQAKHIHMRVHEHTAVQVHMCTQIHIYTHCNPHTPSVNSS